MPVFTRFRDGVLVLTVDGDFTANELRRVAYGAFHADETPRDVPVLLDMGGAAGITSKSREQMQAMGAIFGAYRDRIAGVAVVAPTDVHELFTPGGDFGEHAGARVFACTTHADATRWLKDGAGK